MSMPNSNPLTTLLTMLHLIKNSKDIQGCVNYFIRYAGRPAMAENRITEYNKESKTVSWFYNDHKDEKRYDVTDNVIDFYKSSHHTYTRLPFLNH